MKSGAGKTKGESTKNAIVIENTKDSLGAIVAEYDYIHKNFGKKCIVEEQNLAEKNDRFFDVLTLKLPNGSTKNIFFDITAALSEEEAAEGIEEDEMN